MSRKRKQKAKNIKRQVRPLRNAHTGAHPQPLEATDENQLCLYPDEPVTEDAIAGNPAAPEMTTSSNPQTGSTEPTQEPVATQPAVEQPKDVVDEAKPMADHVARADSLETDSRDAPSAAAAITDESVPVMDADAPHAANGLTASPAAVEPPADNSANVMDLSVPDRDDDGSISLGATLRRARETHSWSMNDVGQRLKLPVRIIERLENDDYAGMTQGVYLRGYLTSYAKLLDVPLDLAVRVADTHAESVPLVATGTTSHSRYLFDRYSVSATYVILTALIIAPAVWLATHGGLEQNLARNLPLDGALISETTTPQHATESSTTHVTGNEMRRQVEVAPPPLISSIASFPSAPAPTPVSTPTSDIVPPAAGTTTAAHHFTLKLSSESWVEILDAKGNRVEYGLLPQGTLHSYEASGPLSVHIGNASAVELKADGKPVDLEPYQRANVARLMLFNTSAAPDSPDPSSHE